MVKPFTLVHIHRPPTRPTPHLSLSSLDVQGAGIGRAWAILNREEGSHAFLRSWPAWGAAPAPRIAASKGSVAGERPRFLVTCVQAETQTRARESRCSGGTRGRERWRETCQTQPASWPPPIPRRPDARPVRSPPFTAHAYWGSVGPRTAPPQAGGPSVSLMANRLAGLPPLQPRGRGGRGCTCPQCLCTCGLPGVGGRLGSQGLGCWGAARGGARPGAGCGGLDSAVVVCAGHSLLPSSSSSPPLHSSDACPPR